MLIYHVASASDWDASKPVGSYRISTTGRSLDEVGFVHCSYAGQVQGVADAFYRSVTEPLVLLAIETDLLGAEVIAEAPAPPAGGSVAGRGVELFPHVYGPIPVSAVVAVTELPRDAGGVIAVPDLAGPGVG